MDIKQNRMDLARNPVRNRDGASSRHGVVDVMDSDLAKLLRVSALCAARTEIDALATERILHAVMGGDTFDDDEQQVYESVARELDELLEAAVDDAMAAGLYGGEHE